MNYITLVLYIKLVIFNLEVTKVLENFVGSYQKEILAQKQLQIQKTSTGEGLLYFSVFF